MNSVKNHYNHTEKDREQTARDGEKGMRAAYKTAISRLITHISREFI